MKAVMKVERHMASAKGSVKEQTGKRRIDPEEKKNRVIQTARRLFVQQGYHNVSIPTIVRESGVSTGAIYNYFPTKTAMAKAIHTETLEHFHALFRQRLSDRTTARERLRAFAEVIFELAESDPETMEYLLFMKHNEFMEDTAPICFSGPFELIRQIIDEGMQQGEIRRSDPFIAGISYTGVILRAVELRFKCVLKNPLSEIADQLIDNAWTSIRA